MQLSIPILEEVKLLNQPNQPFLIVEIGKSPFLLIKARPAKRIETHINFQIGEESYYSTFLRHVNLAYSKILSDILSALGVAISSKIQNEWLMLYQIHSFCPDRRIKVGVETPIYGETAVVEQQNGDIPCFISNVFKKGGQTFYFLTSSEEISEQFRLIKGVGNLVYGITYKVKQTVVCIPFASILSEKPCKMCISEQIKPVLFNTCYISYLNNYCTGFLLNQRTVISVRHVIPFEQQKIGLEVEIRIYPYHQKIHGRITRMGQGSVDLLQISLDDKIICKSHAATLQEPSRQIKTTSSFQIGNEIISAGFGKYSYSPHLFSKIDFVMPSLERGVISKKLIINNDVVFLKTDAAMYNGFSGSGVWLNEKLIGMAIFILKNKNGNSAYNRHNFSYTLDFVRKLLKKKQQNHIISEINAQLQSIDRIQTRNKITLLPKL